ncbi:MAG: dynamin, partial [Aliifodinibius sp.]|nr:dynamin [candidate division Zixibacteria bacterium]NIT57382.1 dynamin [Fodinibius sp.]NIW45170.1 dynamin [Gammaproteobacteria bacterium]NIR64303.1 dynamin [candidate division Zixibacteria bacterium]NIS46206.1 dynamin [candidate division Zixibacteria bacterium]
MQLLTKRQQNFLKEERSTLWKLKEFFIEFGGTEDDKTALSESLQQLDDFFLLVVVGEFNSGKSAVINALLGTTLLKEGVTPTTTQINILQYGEEQSRTIDEDNLVKIKVPVEQLQDLSIVDTPGTNAVIRQHEQITAHFVPRADLVLFITSVD